MKLKSTEVCPIHRSKFCCGRDFRKISRQGKWIRIGPGVKRHVETGLTRRSPAAMRQLVAKKVLEQDGLCAICEQRFDDFREVTADHIEPRGMGGARRNDAADNIRAVCADCNSEKGSKRVAA